MFSGQATLALYCHSFMNIGFELMIKDFLARLVVSHQKVLLSSNYFAWILKKEEVADKQVLKKNSFLKTGSSGVNKGALDTYSRRLRWMKLYF